MGKQSEAKSRQGYRPNPVTKTCRHCQFQESVLLEGRRRASHKCLLGGFVVKMVGTCDEFRWH